VKKRKATSDLWPVHFKPKDDELLSSWLARLAIAHRLKPRDFYSIEVPENSNFLERIDGTQDSQILQWVSRKTGANLDAVEATTFADYGNKYFVKYQSPIAEPYSPNTSPEWVMPISYKKYNRLFGLQFCRDCLLEDEEPYFRRKWRLAFITHCEKHRAILLDRCPKCGASIHFLNSANRVGIEILPTSMIFCRSCNFDLRMTASTSGTQVPEPEEIRHQELLAGLLDYSWLETYPPDSFTPSAYFSVLHQLIKTLAFEELGQFLRTTIRTSYGLPVSSIGRTEHDCLERLSINERRELLNLARQIIEDWPSPFATLEALMKEVVPRHHQNQLRYLMDDLAK
jgi:TniQ